MEFIDLEKQTPKENVPIIITDGENYCCVMRDDTMDDEYIALGCDSTHPYYGVRVILKPTHFAYINET